MKQGRLGQLLGHGPFARPDRAPPPIQMWDRIWLRKPTSTLPPSLPKLYGLDIINASAVGGPIIAPAKYPGW